VAFGQKGSSETASSQGLPRQTVANRLWLLLTRNGHFLDNPAVQELFSSTYLTEFRQSVPEAEGTTPHNQAIGVATERHQTSADMAQMESVYCELVKTVHRFDSEKGRTRGQHGFAGQHSVNQFLSKTRGTLPGHSRAFLSTPTIPQLS